MTSVSVLFYGRRTRSTRNTPDSDELGFLSDRNPSHRHRNTPRKDPRHLHPPTDQHRRRNRRIATAGGEFGDHVGPCSEATAPNIGPIQQLEGATEAPAQNIVHGDILNSIRGRLNSNERLPRSVLLARERLLHRLRGASVSSVRLASYLIVKEPSSFLRRESHSGTRFDSHWLNDSGNWEFGNSGEFLEEASLIAHSSLTAPGQLHETIIKPLPLDREALASLQHEIFTEVTEADGSPKFSDADECSICLERFVEGDELVGLQCGHRFHSSCLCPWVQTCRKCPYCRSEI